MKKYFINSENPITENYNETLPLIKLGSKDKSEKTLININDFNYYPGCGAAVQLDENTIVVFNNNELEARKSLNNLYLKLNKINHFSKVG